MNEVDRYREQAANCRAQAAILTASDAAEQWYKLAAEYDKLASAAERAAAEKP